MFQTSEPRKQLRITSSSGRNIQNEFLNLIDLEKDICDLIDLPEGYLQHLCTTDGIIVILRDFTHFTACRSVTRRDLGNFSVSKTLFEVAPSQCRK